MKKLLLTGIFLGGFLTAGAQCKAVASITENFDTWKEINSCWTARQGKAMLYASDKRIIFYSMTSPGEDMYLITPKVKAGTYTLTFDSSDNGGNTMLGLFTAYNTADTKSYVSVVKPAKITGDKKVFTISLKKDSYIGMKVLLNSIHQAVYIDNFLLKPKK